MKRASLIFAVMLLFIAATTFPAGARQGNTPKEEIVYGILDGEGGIERLLVINSFQLENAGTVLDYGNYAAIDYLTSTEEITPAGSQISFSAKAGRASYQGTLSGRELPWDIQIQYYLDGLRIAPEDLAGKSGLLEIRLRTLENKHERRNYFDDFALQATIPLDRDYCDEISAAGATRGEAGSLVNLSYVILPGEEGSIRLTARIHDFEMAPIQIAAVRMVFDLPLDPVEISNDLDRIVSAASKLDKGSANLVSGAKELKAGLSAYVKAFESLKSGLGQLEEAAGALDAGLVQLDSGLSDLASQGEALRNGADAIRDSAFAQANAQLDGSGLPMLTPENYGSVLAGLPGMESLIASLDQAVAFASAVSAYTGGVDSLSAAGSSLSQGAANLHLGVGTLADGISGLYKGAETLNRSMAAFLSGLGEYRNGTQSYYKGLSDSQKELKGQLDKLTALLPDEGKPYESFVSEENTAVNFLQFVMKTPGIHVDKENQEPPDKGAKESVWDRIRALLSDLFPGLFK